MDEAELKARTKRFALRCMKLADSLPRTRSWNAVGGQLVRCETSVGANYRAACRGRSKPEFLARLGVVEEEADESGFWLELIMEGGLERAELVRPLHQEAEELVRIMASSIRPTRASIRNPNSKIQNQTRRLS